MKRLIIAVGCCIAITSCSKKGSTVSDRELPVITINTPAGNQVFQAGDAISVTGTATDNQKLAEVHVHVYNNMTGAELYDIHHNPLAPSYNFSESFTAQAGILYKIQIMAIDVSANTAYATVYASAN